MRTLLGLAVLAAGLLLNIDYSYGKAEYTKKEKKACTYCHTSKLPKDATKDNLTDAGKYYEKHKSLEGYAPKK
jgi:hypothetical protein